jgi:Na+/proline symporter
VLQIFVLDRFHIPFIASTALILLMIWLYTFKGGVKTIVWTDMLQTTFMLLALFICVWFLKDDLNLSFGKMWQLFSEKNYNQILNSDFNSAGFYWKQILGGAFVTIAMTGLDQEMMQKNISCKNLGDAQKNMISFSFILLLVNFVFLILGGLLYVYIETHHILKPALTDDLFPTLALNYFPPIISILFIIGLISALFPSADGAITALTTSVCIDVLQIDKNEKLDDTRRKQIRQSVQLVIIFVFLLCILYFKWLNKNAVIDTLLKIASYTYGPLLGLYAFGLFSKKQIHDKLAWIVCLAAPVLCYFLNDFVSQHNLLGDYKIGLELLIINGILTYGGLWVISKKD